VTLTGDHGPANTAVLVIREFKSPQLITAQGEAVNKDIKKYID
jgi:hypothetical protein